MTFATARKLDDKTVEIGVEQDSRANVAQALSGFLASTYTLYMKTLYYHWNVTGKQFTSLHELFEKQYDDLHEAGDEIAERIRSLGHFTPGTFREYLAHTAVHEDDSMPENADIMVENLLRDNETCSMEARKILKIAEESEDEVTVDMMVERMATHDEAAWMLRATLQ